MAGNILILTEADLRKAVALDLASIEVVEQAFVALASGKVIMPPVLSMLLHNVNGEVDIKTAFIPGFDGFAVKVSPGFFDNPKHGLPSLNGLMILFNAKTGLVDALLLDNGYLTDVRTAAAGAVAANHLAPEKVTVAGVMGTGVQARLQIQAAHLVRPFSKVLVWGRNAQKAQACADDIGAVLGIKVCVEPDPAALVRQSQLVITTTPALKPVLKANWLHPGLHITAMGSDQAGKNEIEDTALGQVDLYVADRISQCEALGELRSARKAGYLTGTQPELGQIISGKHPGRHSDTDITICDLTGTGAQDTAIATYAFNAAVRASAGHSIST